MQEAASFMSKKLRIGITIGLREEGESLWINGIKQNAIFLMETLRNCQFSGSILLVNMTKIRCDSVLWDRDRWPVVTFADVKDHLDVLIELGGQIGGEQTDYLKQRGVRLISYCCGVEYVQTAEAMLFNNGQWPEGIFINPRYDAVWIIPQVAQTSAHYFRTLRRCPTHIAPFVWHPVLLQERAKDLPDGGEYRPHSGPRRLSVMEPNIDVVKFCLYPILIAEEVHRQQPELIGFMHVTNSQRLAETSPLFIGLMNTLDIVRDRKVSFVGRYDTPEFLANHTDVVISNQWGNPLNYMYLEACWQGYALVHNAELCKDLGYYYTRNNVVEGARQLLSALGAHDESWEQYAENQRSHIAAYFPSSKTVISRYEDLMAGVMAAVTR